MAHFSVEITYSNGSVPNGNQQLEHLQLRFVDFSLYYDFWRSEGLRVLQAELGPGDPAAEGFLRL